MVPFETLFTAVPAVAFRAGVATTVNVTPTTWGLPVIAAVPFSAVNDTEPLYLPAASEDDVIDTVKVPLPPLSTVAGVDTANQPFLLLAVGVIVTLPLHAPITPTVNVCEAGSAPASVVKVKVGTEGACRVHAGCTANVIGMTLGAPTACLVTLSIALTVTEPEYVPAKSPVVETLTVAACDPLALTVPDGVVASHVPPAGVPTEACAAQVMPFGQAPLVVIASGCATGLTPPTTLMKLRPSGETAKEQGAWTVKFTGIERGLPYAELPELSVPIIVIAPE